MFIEQGIKHENKFWKYIVGSLIIILVSSFGQVPWMLGIFAKHFLEGKKGMPELDEKELMTYLEPNLTLFLLMLTFVFGIFGIYIVLKNIHKQTMLSITTSRKKIDWNRIFFSFTVWSLFTIVSTGILYYTSPENFVINFKLVPFLILVVIGTLMIPIQTSCEEYVFRGYLMQGFGNLAKNKWFPLVMTSLIFGLMHIFNPEITKMGYIVLVYYIGTGFFLGILTLMDEGMELSLGFHAANNLVGALLVTADWSAFQTHSILKDISEPSAGFDVLAPVLIIYPILLIVFGKKYKWTNWKEKLTGKIHPTNSNLINEIQGTND